MRAVKNFKADMARQFILNWINTGRFTRGDQIPTEPALAVCYSFCTGSGAIARPFAHAFFARESSAAAQCQRK